MQSMDRGFESHQGCAIFHLIKFRLFQEQLFIIKMGTVTRVWLTFRISTSTIYIYILIMIKIICNIIVMTITVESSAVGGGIEHHQSPIHSESLTRSKTVSFAETHWRKAISMSVWKCIS